ncbi:hypothetical protein H7Q97_10110 [Ochrobactrum sp. CM-21-5]|nr:hypothetical protein [Ochrobactrum sp. CM-21-5]MBC2885759.1 hypothetical protein [Ochrobactrum sp. CM-21-5]
MHYSEISVLMIMEFIREEGETTFQPNPILLLAAENVAGGGLEGRHRDEAIHSADDKPDAETIATQPWTISGQVVWNRIRLGRTPATALPEHHKSNNYPFEQKLEKE